MNGNLQKGPSAGSIIGVIVLIVLVGFICSTLKGGRDGCEASGGRPHGLECVEKDEEKGE